MPLVMQRSGRLLYLLGGHLFLGIALAGAVLPLLPSTPFLLLAAACYLRSSEERYRWLTEHPVMGPMIRDIRERRGLTPQSRVVLVTLVWTWALSVGWRFDALKRPWLGVALLVVAGGGTLLLLRWRARTAPTALPDEA